MNVEADRLAKEVNSIPRCNDSLENLSLKGEIGPISLYDGQRQIKITSNLRSYMYESITKTPTEQYWLRKMDIPTSLGSSVEWQIMDDAFKSLSNEKQKEIVKWNSEFCRTSKNLKRWKEQTHQKCPVCG